jgi:hypothetical protein
VLFRTACSLPSEAQVGDPAADAVNAVCVGMVLALVCFNMCIFVWTVLIQWSGLWPQHPLARTHRNIPAPHRSAPKT